MRDRNDASARPRADAPGAEVEPAAAIERVTCPTCARGFLCDLERPFVAFPSFPFCSERCKLLDLGEWLDESFRISDPLPEDPTEWPTDVPRVIPPEDLPSA